MKKNAAKLSKKERSVKRVSSKKGSTKNSNEDQKTATRDISELILRDHKPIKELILILKDPDASFEKKLPAFAEFEISLSAHAKAEEESLYIYLKGEDETHIEGLEGDTEHVIAAQLMREINESKRDEDIWMAKAKVLAELVDHHVKEEEKEVLKSVRKDFSTEVRSKIGEVYSRLLSKYQGEKSGSKKYSRDDGDIAAYMKH